MNEKQSKGTDIKLLGGTFMLVGMVDAIIIALFPEYSLKLFGAGLAGSASLLIKLHAPAVHLLIGYGFLFLRPWAWGLALAYSGFGLISEGMNQWSFGLSFIRSPFMVTTSLFAIYLVWRRHLFVEQPECEKKTNAVSQESR
jgi:hypothetical protein